MLVRRIGSLLPSEDKKAAFSQIWMMDMADGNKRRLEVIRDLNGVMLDDLSKIVSECNPYAAVFKSAKEKLAKDHSNADDLQLIIKDVNKAFDRKIYNAPTADELAALIPRESNADFAPASRDIVIEGRGSGELCRV